MLKPLYASLLPVPAFQHSGNDRRTNEHRNLTSL